MTLGSACEFRAKFYVETVQTSPEEFTKAIEKSERIQTCRADRFYRTLEQVIGVRIPASQPQLSRSRSFACLVGSSSVTSRLAFGSPGMGANPCLPATLKSLHPSNLSAGRIRQHSLTQSGLASRNTSKGNAPEIFNLMRTLPSAVSHQTKHVGVASSPSGSPSATFVAREVVLGPQGIHGSERRSSEGVLHVATGRWIADLGRE